MSDTSDKVALDFCICPDEMVNKCYVPDSVRIRVIDPEAIFLTGILGESGRKMILAGCEFFFTKKLADRLISMGIAKEVI